MAFTLNPKTLWNRYISRKPWFDMKTNGIPEDGSVKVEMDWNKAFINDLRRNGFSGHNEEEIVQEYLSLLMNPPAADMQEDEVQEITSADHPQLSDGHYIKR